MRPAVQNIRIAKLLCTKRHARNTTTQYTIIKGMHAIPQHYDIAKMRLRVFELVRSVAAAASSTTTLHFILILTAVASGGLAWLVVTSSIAAASCNISHNCQSNRNTYHTLRFLVIWKYLSQLHPFLTIYCLILVNHCQVAFSCWFAEASTHLSIAGCLVYQSTKNSTLVLETREHENLQWETNTNKLRVIVRGNWNGQSC